MAEKIRRPSPVPGGTEGIPKPLITCSSEFIRFLRWVADGEEMHMYSLWPQHMDTWDMRERMGHLLDIIEKPHHYEREFKVFQESEDKENADNS